MVPAHGRSCTITLQYSQYPQTEPVEYLSFSESISTSSCCISSVLVTWLAQENDKIAKKMHTQNFMLTPAILKSDKGH